MRHQTKKKNHRVFKARKQDMSQVVSLAQGQRTVRWSTTNVMCHREPRSRKVSNSHASVALLKNDTVLQSMRTRWKLQELFVSLGIVSQVKTGVKAI